MPRTRGRARHNPQTSIYEKQIENPELENLLETRESMRDAESTAKHNAKVAHDAAEAEIVKLEMGDGAAIRVGRFVVSVKKTKGHTVQSFEVAGQERIRIRTLGEDA